MSFSKPKKQKEPPEAKALRARQVADLAQLDEEQNRRIKAMFRARGGGRAFRSPTAARTATNSAGNMQGGSTGSLVPASGFTLPASIATRGLVRMGGMTR